MNLEIVGVIDPKTSDQMNINGLREALAARVAPSALKDLHGLIALDCGREVLHLKLEQGQLHWPDVEPNSALNQTQDVTFFFESPHHAFELLSGSGDVIAEFMSGRFRSTGYLLWTFPLLSLFRGEGVAGS